MAHQILQLFQEQSSLYRLKEIGDGTHDFTKRVLEGIFGLAPKSSLVPESSLFGESLYDNFYVYEGSKKQGASARWDFRCKINGQRVVVETERLDNIEAGMKQIGGYMKAENTHYGIVTDGGIWRFFKHGADHLDQYETLTIDQLCSTDGQAFLQNFYNTYDFYLQRLSSVESKPFDTQIFHQGLITTAERIVFDLRHIGLFTGSSQEVAKEEIQTAYSLIIQILLIKIVQDKRKINLLKKDIIVDKLKQQDRNGIFEAVEGQLNWLGDFYSPYHNQQDSLLNKIIGHYQQGSRIAKLNLDSVRLFLDLYHFIYSFDFKDIKQDLFGAVYENYLKELYKDDDTKKGQVFTPPEIVEFMLDEIGYTVDYIQKIIITNLPILKEHLEDSSFNIDGLSLIDPACGSGTFLYKSAGRIVNALYNIRKENKIDDTQAGKIAELLICNNIVGFDIEPFPLYLAEMNILQSLLFFNVSADGSVLNPIDTQIKIFSTDDSIAEFHNLESSMEKDLQDLIAGGELSTLASKRDPKSILQLKADLQDFDREALMTKFQLELYYKALQNDFFIIDSGELIKTKSKTYRDKHHKKITSLTSLKDLLAYVRSTLDDKYLGLFEKSIEKLKPQLEHIRNELADKITKAKTKRTKFDFVIANPPYVYTDAKEKEMFGYNINDSKYTKVDTKYENYKQGLEFDYQKPSGTTSKFNLFGYFYYLAVFLLKTNGKFSFITPRSLINKLSFYKLRRFLKYEGEINKIIDFQQGSLFYNRGVGSNIVVGTDSVIINFTKHKGIEDVTIQEYIGDGGKITLEDFKLKNTIKKVKYQELFERSLPKNLGYFIDYYFDLQKQDPDFHYSILPGIDTSKSNFEGRGYPIYEMRGYYNAQENITRYFDLDKEGAAKNRPTCMGILNKQYRLVLNYFNRSNTVAFSDYKRIQNRGNWIGIGTNKHSNLNEIYYLFGIFNSYFAKEYLIENFDNIWTLTSIKLLPVPLLNTPAKLALKSDLIANSEAIISLCKQGSSGGQQTRGDICETVFDPDSLGEKITGLKAQYIHLGISIPSSIQTGDVLSDEILILLSSETSDLTKLEQERDEIVKKLYELE